MDFEQQIGILARRGRVRGAFARKMGLFSGDGGDGGGGAGGEGEGQDEGGEGQGEGSGEGQGDGGGQSSEELAAMQKRIEEMSGELDRYKAKHKEQERHLREAEAEARRKAKEAGDAEALDKSWQEKYTKREQELRSELEKYEGMMQDLTAGAEAQRIASELAVQGSAKALMPHIRSRLKTEIRDGKPTTVVMDEDGKPSAMTLDELREQFRSDPAFAPLIVGSKANGSGGPGSSPVGDGNTISAEDLGKMSPKQKAAYFKQHPNATVTD
jgi:hypothetical protein